MKVLYISGMYPTPEYPQKGIFCHEQVKALKCLGVDVDVAVPVPFYSKEPDRREWDHEGVHIRYVRFFKLPGARDFQRTGKNLFPALDRAFDLKKYDIYHADAALPTGQAAMIAGKKYGKPYVVHGHGLDVFLEVDFAEKKNRDKISKEAIKVYDSCSAFVGVSQKVVDVLCNRLPISQKSFVVYNGVDPHIFVPDNHGAEARDELRIMSVGNLIELKGHDLTINAVSDLVSSGKRITLDIYGRGPLIGELQELVKTKQAGDYISFKGYISYDRLAEKYRDYDVFLLPSWFEALGCVYLEAMSSGLITVGCYDNGIDEIIKNGENGFLVNPHSVSEIEDVLRFIISLDRNKRRDMIQSARETVQSGFTWNHSAMQLQKVYEWSIK